MSSSPKVLGSFLYGQPCSERNTAYLQSVSPQLPTKDEVKCLDITSFKKHLRHKANLSNFTSFFEKIANADTLFADHMNLTRFPVGVIKKLKKLEMIDISGNQIRKIPHKMFKLAPKLDKLLMSDNRVMIPKKMPLISSKTLQTLMLSNNDIEMIYKITFSKLPALKVLYLDSNKLRNIVPLLGVMPSLQYLHVGQNYLTEIPNKQLVSPVLKQYITKSQKADNPEDKIGPLK